MKKLTELFLSSVLFSLIVTSCDLSTNKQDTTIETSSEKVDTVAEKVDTIKAVTVQKKESKKKEKVKEQEPKQVEQKNQEMPTEIGASPDAVYSLDDNETESSPKYPDGEKNLKKLLKKQLRKAGKGEKATFRVSMVVKKDGSVGRVQFSSCGYSDEYKPEIITVLQSLPAFTPGVKNGVPVDSWYYLTYKR